MDSDGVVVWMLLICSMIMVNHDIGGVEAKRLSGFQDLEIKKQLKLINKPAVKIIKTTYGERYGCVDFYKQLAFDDPSLKNHTFHHTMRLTLYPKGFEQRRRTTNNTFGFLWENGVGCPYGTVPIQRVTKNQLIRMNSLIHKYYPQASSNRKGHHYAVVRTKGSDGIYNGATMDCSVNNPSVEKTQFSSSRVHVQIGSDSFIQAGWTVNPYVYTDTKPRLYVFTKVGGSNCYNSLCGVGMISVRQDIPLGLEFQIVSVRGKSFHFESIGVIKDQANGNWWLTLRGEEIGFWPGKRFRQASGTAVEWGGEVFSKSPPSPPMGNGHFPEGDMKLDAFVARISIIDSNFKFDYKVKNTESYTDNSDGYKVRDTVESWYKNAGHLVVYGGPGNI